MLLLPLADETGEIMRIMSGLVTDAPLGPRRRRLSIDNAQPIRVEPVASRATPVMVPQQRLDNLHRPALRLVVDNGRLASFGLGYHRAARRQFL